MRFVKKKDMNPYSLPKAIARQLTMDRIRIPKHKENKSRCTSSTEKSKNAVEHFLSWSHL